MPVTVRRRHSLASSRYVRLGALSLVALPAALWLASLSTRAAGTVGLTTSGVAYTQDFDTLASTGTANTTVPTGWEFSESGTNANATYQAGTGSGNAGDTYSFGASGSAERAFGGLRSGSLVPLVGAQFTNNTGVAITSLGISYTGEQWRLGQNTAGRAADRLDFQISTDATSLTSGTWTNDDTLDFASPLVAGTVGAQNGNAATNRTVVVGTITGLDIPAGATFWIRWADTDLIPGADDGLAIDDFSLTPNGIGVAPLPTLSVNDVTLAEGNSGTTSFTFTVSLSAAAGADGVSFDIVTADGTAAAPVDYLANALAGQTIPAGSSTFTFTALVNGDATFEANETFSVNVTNVTGARVSDGQGRGVITNDDLLVCGETPTLISAIQGSGTTSPLVGQFATIEGIVVGDYQDVGQFGGYFVQEQAADSDGDPTTSEGLFVFNTSFPVNVGDKVLVAGTVAEFPGSGPSLTQITGVAARTVCASGEQIPATDVQLPVADLAHLERYEGMLVTFTQPLTVTDTFTVARFGEVMLSVGGRLPAPTHAALPGAPALAQESLNERSRIVLDDGNNQQNIDPTRYPTGGLSASNTVRSGDQVDGALTGVLDHRFAEYRVQPVGAVSFRAENPRTVAPAGVGSANLRVASFNVLNYFNGNGLGGGFPTSRGAESLFEFDRQRAKILSAILGLDADIAGLIELENDPAGNSAIEDLVAGLNDATAPGTYSFINTGVIGLDEIRVGLIYKPSVVTPWGDYAVLDSTVDPNFIDTLNRPALAQTFALDSNGARITVVVNHLKSKGSDCNAVGDPDLGDGQGNCNVTRTKAAQALVQWLATDPTGSAESDVLIVGDLNSYRKEDPITAIRAAGYTDLLDADAAYSYVFDGGAGYLDHALASPTLAAQVTGVTEWHVNADEPIALDYNANFKSANHVNTLFAPDAYRSSDHDPVLIGLNLAAPYDFGGLERPVDGSAAVTTVKAGSSVPLKFSLGGDKGLDIFAAGSPSSLQSPCDADAPLVVGEQAETAGQSVLTYDPLTDQYTFVWKTARAWAGTCRTLTVRFTDGTWYRTAFSFR